MSNTLPIRGIYDEWEREEKSRRDQSDRLKDLFKRAKDGGYNAKALRQAFAERYALDHLTGEKLQKRDRDASDVDLYLANLAGVRTREIIEEIPPHDEDGVIIERAETPNQVDGSPEGRAGKNHARDALAQIGTVPPVKAAQPPASDEVAFASTGDSIRGLVPEAKSPAGTQAPPVDTHSKPAEGNTPTSAGHGDRGAVVPSVAPVDRSQPNPWCMDPEECGVEASWDYMCLKCTAVKKGREAAGAALQ